MTINSPCGDTLPALNELDPGTGLDGNLMSLVETTIHDQDLGVVKLLPSEDLGGGVENVGAVNIVINNMNLRVSPSES